MAYAYEWNLMSRITKCSGPILLIIRLGDLKQATLSKLKGTVDYVKRLMVETDTDSLEDQIAKCFHNRVEDLESDVANAAYCIDPQFVRRSKDAPREVMDSFWKVSRQILGHTLSNEQWLPIRTTLARELQSFRMKSGGFACEDYSMEDTCIFWGVAGCHAPTLKKIAFALAPQPTSSSEAERNWFELKSNKTKTRNRLGKTTLQKIVFVRRFLRLQKKILTSDIDDTGYKTWVRRLLRDAAQVIDASENDLPEGGNDEEDMNTLTIFNDTIEPGEQGKINGLEPGQPITRLSTLRKDKAARSWLFEKYYNMCFVDKNPEEPSGGAEPLEDTSKWEHRIIQNVVWSRHTGHVVDTVLINGSDGDDSETYFIDEVLLQMIRDSPHNQRRIKSKIVDPPSNDINGQPTESEQAGSDSDSDSSAEEENRHQLTATV